MKILIFIIMLLLIGAFFIISQNNLALNNSENIKTFFSSYNNWINNLIGNVGELTGYIVKLEWLPEPN